MRVSCGGRRVGEICQPCRKEAERAVVGDLGTRTQCSNSNRTGVGVPVAAARWPPPSHVSILVDLGLELPASTRPVPALASLILP